MNDDRRASIYAGDAAAFGEYARQRPGREPQGWTIETIDRQDRYEAAAGEYGEAA